MSKRKESDNITATKNDTLFIPAVLNSESSLGNGQYPKASINYDFVHDKITQNHGEVESCFDK